MVAAAPSALQGVSGDQFRTVIDSEIVIFDASQVSTTIWTALERGAEGSTAATHSSGASVFHDLTAAGLQAFVDQNAGLPVSGVLTSGNLLQSTGSAAQDSGVATSSVVIGTGTPTSGQLAAFTGTGYETAPVASGDGLPDNFVTKTTTYTASPNDFVEADVSSAGFTVTLPTDPAVGSLVAVQKTDSSSNTLTVMAYGSGTINGSASVTTTTQDAGWVFEFTGQSAGNDVWVVAGVLNAGGSGLITGINEPGQALIQGQITSITSVLEQNRTQMAASLFAATNAASALTISTPDSSGQVVEPAIEYIPWGWQGHKYWGLITGYTNGDPTTENPSLYYSDDGTTWTSAGASLFPIVGYPGSSVYNADPEILLGPDNKLHMFWIKAGTTPTGTTSVMWCTYDGTTLTTPTAILGPTTNTTEAVTAPIFMYDGINDQWVMEYTDCANYYNATSTAYVRRRRTCPGQQPNGTWSSSSVVTISGIPAGESPWEGHWARVGEELHMVITCCTTVNYPTGNGSSTGLYFAVSDDGGLTWTLDSTPILTASGGSNWDSTLMYRGDIIPLNDGSNGAHQLWYSAENSSGAWHFGRTTITRNIAVNSIDGVAVTGTPSVGQAIIATSSTAASWQNPGGGGAGSAYQNGVINLADLGISSISINGSTGEITFTLAGANPCIVNGSQVTFGGGTSNETPGTLPSSGDSLVVGLEMDSSGGLHVISGTGVSGTMSTASALETNTPATTSGRLRIYDFGVYNNSGTYEFSNNSSTATQGTNWVDRRPWARGARWSTMLTSANYSSSTGSYQNVDATNLQQRLECSGVPVRVRLFGSLEASGGGAEAVLACNLDGAIAVSGTSNSLDNAQITYPLSAGEIEGGSLYDYIFPSPGAGSHLFTMMWRIASGTALLGIGNPYGIGMEIAEILPSAGNGSA